MDALVFPPDEWELVRRLLRNVIPLAYARLVDPFPVDPADVPADAVIVMKRTLLRHADAIAADPQDDETARLIVATLIAVLAAGSVAGGTGGGALACFPAGYDGERAGLAGEGRGVPGGVPVAVDGADRFGGEPGERPGNGAYPGSGRFSAVAETEIMRGRHCPVLLPPSRAQHGNVSVPGARASREAPSASADTWHVSCVSGWLSPECRGIFRRAGADCARANGCIPGLRSVRP